jgi:hypothetical protein
VLVSQLGRSTPGARAVVTALVRRWQGGITAGSRHVQEAGEVDAGMDADTVAAAIGTRHR